MRYLLLLFLCLMTGYSNAQTTAAAPKAEAVYLLKPAHVFDGESAQLHDGWVVVVRGDKIEAAGPAFRPGSSRP